MVKSIGRFICISRLGNLLLLILIGIALYSNTLENTWHLDDYHAILENHQIRSFNNFLDVDLWTNLNHRVVAKITFAINYSLDEYEPEGYHWVNIGIHILSGFLVLLVSDRIFKRCGLSGWYLPLIVAILFLIHPLQTQPLSYIVQRMTLLMGLFYLGSIYFYVLFRDTKGLLKKIIFSFLALICFVFSIESKQTAASIPICWMLVEILFYSNRRKQIVLGVLTVIFLIGISILAIYFPPFQTFDTPLISRADYFTTQLMVMWKYVQMLLVPVNQNFDHHILLIRWGTSSGYMYMLCHLLCIAFAVYRMVKKDYLPAFLLGWFYLTLSVESSIFPIRDLMFEHRMYLGVMSFGMVVALLVDWLNKRSSLFAVLFIFLLFGIYFQLTLTRNQVWKTEFSLWSDTVRKSPQKDRPNYLHASNLRAKENIPSAIRFYHKTLELNPKHAEANNDLGAIYLQQNELEKAAIHLKRAIEIRSNYQLALTNYGLLKLYELNAAEAIIYFEQVVNLDATADGLFNLGFAYQSNNQLDDADVCYRIALQKDSLHFNSHFYLGALKAQIGSYPDAIRQFQICRRLNPNDMEILRNLAMAYQLSGFLQEALESYQALLRHLPNDKSAIESLNNIREKLNI